jgi:hypothetical protein
VGALSTLTYNPGSCGIEIFPGATSNPHFGRHVKYLCPPTVPLFMPVGCRRATHVGGGDGPSASGAIMAVQDRRDVRSHQATLMQVGGGKGGCELAKFLTELRVCLQALAACARASKTADNRIEASVFSMARCHLWLCQLRLAMIYEV